MTQEMLADEQRYLTLYDQYLDEPDPIKRTELVIEMNKIEAKYGGF